MSERARSITAERLNDRLPVDNPDDEMGRLAAVFNETLGRLERSFEQMRQFTADVSHELRTPLTSIRAFTEILNQEPEIDAAQRQKFLGIVTKETERLTRLINQVLDLAKIESGRADWHETRVDMREVILDAAGAMEQVLQEKAIRLELKLPPRVPPVRADLDRMTQVMLNLLSNAVKFCDQAAGRIEIELSERAGGLRVDVRDNGPGVAPQDREIIFEKFRQVGDTLTEKPHGTGLGLPISRHIIERHGGRIWVESRDEGACFSFTLPLARDAALEKAA
jgi:signal transduction histidine kinase